MSTATLAPDRIVIRRPTATGRSIDRGTPTAPVAKRPLAGCRVGMRTEGQWASWLFIVDDWKRRLEQAGAIADVLITNPYKLADELKEERRRVATWAEAIDVGISGLGTCGSCTSYTVTDGIKIAEAGKPTALAITEAFVGHAESIAKVLGHPEIKILKLPHPLEGLPEAQLSAVAAEYYPRFLDLVGVRA
jgi:hypothetical protein